MKERTEFYCHGCDGYIAVELDMSLNGNHEVHCPKCDHIHYRVIVDGRVTEERYRSSAGAIIQYQTNMTNYSTTAITSGTAVTTSAFTTMAWNNSTGTGSGIMWATA